MSFKSVKEFLEALASGKKVRHVDWESPLYISLFDGEIQTNNEAPFSPIVNHYDQYELCQEEKSITLYQVFYRYKFCEHSETEMCESEKQWFIDNECSRSDLDFIHFVPVTIPNEAFIRNNDSTIKDSK